MDPLLLLRSTLSSTINNKLILLSFPITILTTSTPSTPSTSTLDTSLATEVFELQECTHILFPSTSTTTTSTTKPIFSKSILTRWYKSKPECYDLETLLNAFSLKDLSVGEYIKTCREKLIGFVSVQDRKIIIDWLSGKTNLESVNDKLKPFTIDNDLITTTTNTTTNNFIVGNEIGVKVESSDSDKMEGIESNIISTTTTGSDINKRTNDQISTSTSTTSNDINSTTTTTATTTTEVLPPVKRARYVVDKLDQEKVKKMIILINGTRLQKSGGAFKDRETTLRGERMNNFESAKLLVGPRLKLARDENIRLQNLASSSKGVVATASTSNSTSSSSSSTGVKPRKKQVNPIIMISPSSTALITMHNVKKFLEESIFEPSEQARKSNLESNGGSTNGRIAEDVIIINHARSNISSNSSSSTSTNNLGKSLGNNSNGEVRKARYFVVDGVDALSKFGGIEEAWERVVCVMTTGQEWQFKPYKWTEPKELFHHVKGIHVQWTTDKPNSKVRAWNVTELRIDQHKRHIDKSTVADFWRTLENYIAVKKPNLEY